MPGGLDELAPACCTKCTCPPHACLPTDSVSCLPSAAASFLTPPHYRHSSIPHQTTQTTKGPSPHPSGPGAPPRPSCCHPTKRPSPPPFPRGPRPPPLNAHLTEALLQEALPSLPTPPRPLVSRAPCHAAAGAAPALRLLLSAHPHPRRPPTPPPAPCPAGKADKEEHPRLVAKKFGIDYDTHLELNPWCLGTKKVKKEQDVW